MTSRITPFLLAFASMHAYAQFSIDTTAVIAGPAACGATFFDQPVTGTITNNLSTIQPNVVVIRVINGVQYIDASSVQPTGTFPLGVLPLGIFPAVDPPYSFIYTELPLVNGTPAGVGIRFSGSCAKNGSSTFAIERGVLAPVAPVGSTIAVPALSRNWLAFLALLLIGLAARRLHRQVR